MCCMRNRKELLSPCQRIDVLTYLAEIESREDILIISIHFHSHFLMQPPSLLFSLAPLLYQKLSVSVCPSSGFLILTHSIPGALTSPASVAP
jgi:hypothetical protein